MVALENNNYMENTEKQELFICACHKVEHQMIMRWWEDDDEEEKLVCCEIHLNKLPFFKRLIHGIKYILGYTSAVGDFEEFIFKQEDAYRLQKMVTFLKNKENVGNK